MNNTEKDKEIWTEGFNTLFPTWDNNDVLEQREQSQIRAFVQGVQSNYVRKQIIKAKSEALEDFVTKVTSILELERLKTKLNLLDDE